MELISFLVMDETASATAESGVIENSPRCNTVCACLAFSAFFEMIEWWAALAWGGAADAFLATQGDVWDTQWDMFLALCGAIISQLVLAKWHNRQLGL